jgi:hypothetical protein
MAWPERAQLSAHAGRATPSQCLQYQTASCVAASTKRHQPNLRASNSGALPPCHHIRPHKSGPFFSSQLYDVQSSNSRTALFNCSVIRTRESIQNRFYFSRPVLHIPEIRFVIITWSSVAPPYQPHCMEFGTACTASGDLLGDNCSVLLC